MVRSLNLLPRIAATACLAAVCAAHAWAETSGVERTYLERAAISAADQSCNLFSEGERFALRSGLYQTEGELLRAGRSPSEIRALTAEVAGHARSLGCEHPSVLQVASTIRNSYRQFAKTNWIEYPAEHSLWGVSRSQHDAWAAMQQDKASGVSFGLRRHGPDKALTLALAIPAKGRPPASAQLIARDPARSRDPWLGSLLGPAKGVSTPPRSISTPEWAGEFRREQDAVGDPLHVFYFSAAAIARIEALDPREGVVFELTPSSMSKDAKPVRHVFEVGDIRAAHAFAQIPPPEYPAAGAQTASAAH